MSDPWDPTPDPEGPPATPQPNARYVRELEALNRDLLKQVAELEAELRKYEPSDGVMQQWPIYEGRATAGPGPWFLMVTDDSSKKAPGPPNVSPEPGATLRNVRAASEASSEMESKRESDESL